MSQSALAMAKLIFLEQMELYCKYRVARGLKQQEENDYYFLHAFPSLASVIGSQTKQFSCQTTNKEINLTVYNPSMQ